MNIYQLTVNVMSLPTPYDSYNGYYFCGLVVLIDKELMQFSYLVTVGVISYSFLITASIISFSTIKY